MSKLKMLTVTTRRGSVLAECDNCLRHWIMIDVQIGVGSLWGCPHCGCLGGREVAEVIGDVEVGERTQAPQATPMADDSSKPAAPVAAESQVDGAEALALVLYFLGKHKDRVCAPDNLNPDRPVGAATADAIGIIPSALDTALAGKWRRIDVLRDWRNRGWLVIQRSDEFSARLLVPGASRGFGAYYIKRTAFEDCGLSLSTKATTDGAQAEQRDDISARVEAMRYALLWVRSGPYPVTFGEIRRWCHRQGYDKRASQNRLSGAIGGLCGPHRMAKKLPDGRIAPISYGGGA